MAEQEKLMKTFDLITKSLQELAEKQKVIHSDIKKILDANQKEKEAPKLNGHK